MSGGGTSSGGSRQGRGVCRPDDEQRGANDDGRHHRTAEVSDPAVIPVRQTAANVVHTTGGASEVRVCAGTYGDDYKDEGREGNGGEEL